MVAIEGSILHYIDGSAVYLGTGCIKYNSHEVKGRPSHLSDCSKHVYSGANLDFFVLKISHLHGSYWLIFLYYIPIATISSK